MLPRKEFQVYTDPWLDAYNQRTNSKTRRRQAKTFSSLDQAHCEFFKDFCQETTAYHYYFSAIPAMDYVNQPLGWSSLISRAIFILASPILITREYFLGGNVLSHFCKHAVASTINSTYVVCCKEKLTFEEGLHKHPWAQGVFAKRQLHPMIGRAVCPLYKRKVFFPTSWPQQQQQADTMDFDYEIIPNPTAGTLILRQIYSSQVETLVNNLLQPRQVIVVSWSMYMIWWCWNSSSFEECFNSLVTMLLFAGTFYLIRTVVDHQLGVHWVDLYKYSP